MLSGARQTEESALALLSQYDYDFVQAKFHVIFPVLVEQHRQDILSAALKSGAFVFDHKTLEPLVNAAVNDLIGVKQQQRD